MKTSLKKLQKFAVLTHENRTLKKHHPPAYDELAQATQDMNDMRNCYDRLLSAAAATSNSVYEFSESLREMGDCLLEKTSLSDDEESGKVLLMLGKAQFELQKLVDCYRSHIIQTITVPSESLLNELHTVEEMKRRCDGKREIYEQLMKKQKEKGRLRNNKGECYSSHQLQEAHDEYDEEANVFVFRMKSLKQGQSRNLLTQASRHHAAQLCFVKKALRSLDAIEPHVRLVAEQQHIDYQFSSLKDDETVVDVDIDVDEESDSVGDGDTENDYKEQEILSFASARNRTGPEESDLKNPMELDVLEDAVFTVHKLDATKEILRNFGQTSFHGEVRAFSQSAPLFPEKKYDQAERRAHLQPSASRKFTSYVLPTPEEMKIPASQKLKNEVSYTRSATPILWHSSPLGQSKYDKRVENDKSSGPIFLDSQSILKESNNRKPVWLPPPLSEGLSFNHMDPSVASYAKKLKRQAFSGPLTDKPWITNTSNLSASGPISTTGHPPPISGSLLRTPFPPPVSAPKLSPRVTPSSLPSLRISELHELPLPPSHLAGKRNPDTNSGPIISRSRELSKVRIPTKSAPSTLPTPPPTLPRSYSIPAGGLMEIALRVPFEVSPDSKVEDASSAPLTPILLPTTEPASPAK